MTTTPSFATFWAGRRVTGFEAACLMSYVKRGYAITVYTYEPVENLPAGVRVADAGEIVDRSFVDAYLIKGVPSLSHFSDLFRYRLFSRTPHIWVDSDMYLLRRFDSDLPTTLLAREDATTLCGAIMRLDPSGPALPRLVEQTEALAGQNLQWGETGPRLLTAVFGAKVMASSHGPEMFYPVHYDEFWKVFLPEYREECEALCRSSHTLHLWNNIVTKVGVWKDVLPPEGSYLGQLLVQDGMSDLFVGTFPAGAMHHVIDNYRMRLSGTFKDVTKLVSLAIPGVRRRTIRHLRQIRHRLTAS